MDEDDTLVESRRERERPPDYKMPESRSAFCKIVSLTAAKTRLI